ncbi:MAG: hypothetical protein KKE20_07380, partial [Nanoarchaeota archaeon]|nr:hypothetical protein [Nanoarchaeota archaeon]
EKGKKDYIVWLHEQSAAKGRQGETHISIFSPKEICETGDFDRLFKLTCEYIASLAESSTDNTDS